MKKFWLYFHTIRFLKFQQVVYRIWYKFYRPSPRALGANTQLRTSESPFFFLKNTNSRLGTHTFQFINETRELSGDSRWNPDGASPLWLYNLHYFDYLNCETSDPGQTALVMDWILTQPFGSHPGWDPYPLSLRVCNWIKWLYSSTESKERQVILNSLAQQLDYLCGKKEYHLLANHLFANLKALVFGGLSLEHPNADLWLKKSLQELDKQLDVQILADGGHFERSPMYHAIILEDILDIIHLDHATGQKLPDSLRHKLKKTAANMIPWLRGLSYQDLQLASFNDSADGIAKTPLELFSSANRANIPIAPRKLGGILFGDTGYFRFENDRIICIGDIGDVGPSYQPGHAHADTLSCELAVDGHRFFVNGGTSCYGMVPQRFFERSTANHSAIRYKDISSSEVWSSFRVARRAHPYSLKVSADSLNSWSVECSHDGYRTIQSSLGTKREWCFESNTVVIRDSLSPFASKNLVQGFISQYILHPDVQVKVVNNKSCILIHGSTRIRVEFSSDFGLGKSSFSSEFGKVLETRVLRQNFTALSVEVKLSFDQ